MIENRNNFVDLLRFVAAIWVLLYHFNGYSPDLGTLYKGVTKIGYLGVPIFFVISGYCIMLAASHSSSAFSFLIRRLFRIFPAFWLSMIIVLFIVVINTILYGQNSVTILPKDFWSILASITLFSSPLTNVKTINWVYWSLTFEIFFYIIIYIYLNFNIKFRFYWLLFLSIISLFVPKHDYWLFFFAQHWSSFLLGIAIYCVHTQKNNKHESFILLTLAITGLFYNVGHLPYYQTICLVTAFLIFLSNYYKLKNNNFSKLGDYSYAIYLIHVPIGIYLLGSIKQKYLIQANDLTNIIWDIFLYVIILVISKWIYIKFELPFILIGKKISNYFNTVN